MVLSLDDIREALEVQHREENVRDTVKWLEDLIDRAKELERENAELKGEGG